MPQRSSSDDSNRTNKEPFVARSKKSSAVQPSYLTISDVATMLNLGRTKVYDLIKHEGLPTIQFGDVKRVPVAKLQRWLEARE